MEAKQKSIRHGQEFAPGWGECLQKCSVPQVTVCLLLALKPGSQRTAVPSCETCFTFSCRPPVLPQGGAGGQLGVTSCLLLIALTGVIFSVFLQCPLAPPTLPLCPPMHSMLPVVIGFTAPTCFPGGSAGKGSTCDAGGLSSIPELGRSPGEGIGYPLQYSWASLVARLVKNPPAMQQA